MTTPDLATRLLDACEKLGVDTGPYRKDGDGWHKLVFNTETQEYDRYNASEATRTEIESLAFRLEGKLLSSGWCQYMTNADEYQWLKHGLGPEHPDRIEAIILAAGKMGGEG